LTWQPAGATISFSLRLNFRKVTINLKAAWPLLKGTVDEFSKDNVLRLSAALAYYAMFSIGPLLAIVVGVAGLVFGRGTVKQYVQHELEQLVGPSSATTISTMMSPKTHTGSLLTTVIGTVAFLAGAGGVFGQLQDALNTIWEVKPKPGGGVWAFIRARFLSFTMVLGTGFLLLVSLALTTFLSAMSGSFGSKLPISATLAHLFSFIISFGVITLLFAMIFKYLPDVKIPFRNVWVGAIGTALLFSVGKHLLSLYLGRESTTSYYGAAGSVIVVLLWVYYASVILFFGAEFTQVYSRRTGAQLKPTQYAVPVTEEQRAEEGIPHETAPTPAGARPPGRPRTPGAAVHKRPLGFLVLMLAAGFAGGTLLSIKPLRKGLKLYSLIKQRTRV
jgi:membrane protein